MIFPGLRDLALQYTLRAGTSSATGEVSDLQIVLGGTAALRVHSNAGGGTPCFLSQGVHSIHAGVK